MYLAPRFGEHRAEYLECASPQSSPMEGEIRDGSELTVVCCVAASIKHDFGLVWGLRASFQKHG